MEGACGPWRSWLPGTPGPTTDKAGQPPLISWPVQPSPDFLKPSSLQCVVLAAAWPVRIDLLCLAPRADLLVPLRRPPHRGTARQVCTPSRSDHHQPRAQQAEPVLRLGRAGGVCRPLPPLLLPAVLLYPGRFPPLHAVLSSAACLLATSANLPVASWLFLSLVRAMSSDLQTCLQCMCSICLWRVADDMLWWCHCVAGPC